MTTALTMTVSPPPITGGPATRRGATVTVLTLARAESWRLLRHPAILVGLLLTAAPWVYEWLSGGLATRYPVLHDEDRFVQLPMLLLAAGTLLAANLAVLRVQRDKMVAFYSVQLTTTAQRTVAHLLSLLSLAILAGAVVALRLVWLAAAPGAIGRVSVLEAVTPPLVVLLAGVVGLFLARLTTALVAAPLTIVALAMLVLFSAVGPQWSRWVGPIAFEDETVGSLPPHLMYRPVVWHLVYLAALLAALALVTVGLSGARWSLTAPAAVVAAVVVAVTGALQNSPVPDHIVDARSQAATRPADEQVCRDVDSVRFCAFPPYEQRSEQWAAVTRGILRWAPEQVADASYVVRQRIFLKSSAELTDPVPVEDWRADDAAAGTPESVPVSTVWGDREGYSEIQMIQFSGAFANRAVTGSAAAIYDNAVICGARGLLILWLGAQATQETENAYRQSLEHSYGGSVVMAVLTSASGPSFPRETADLVRDLLDRPVGEVGAQMRQNWQKLADPATGLAEGAQLLGMRAPAGRASGLRC
ncbi:hypothetical protein [Rhizomonospora bruguierae]|uniref:hypothetical protein n=1 Tax=Rhizomonospora bruguierae TaxID=1581705 RepID=UPI001BD0E477|nr:hypothetical protein [Micromonospora sp. NBRC 107566]